MRVDATMMGTIKYPSASKEKMPMFNPSWRLKLMALSMLILGASLLFQLFYIVPYFRNREVEMAQVHQEEIARSVASEMDTRLESFRLGLAHVACLPEVYSMDPSTLQQVSSQGAGMVRRLHALFVMGAEGRFVAGSADDFSPYTDESYASAPFFVGPFERGETYFGAPWFAESEGIVILPVSVPIESPATGKRVGVLLGLFDLREVFGRVHRPLREDQDVFLLDGEGRVFAHSGKDQFGPEGAPFSLEDSDGTLVRAVVEGERIGSLEYDRAGERYLGYHVALETNGWWVVVETPMRSIFAPSDNLARHLSSVTLALFLVAFSFSLVFTRQITDDQRRAEDALRQRTAQLEALREVGLELVAQLDLDALFHSIVSRAVDLLGGTGGGLALHRPERGVLEMVTSVGDAAVPSGSTFRQGEGLAGTVWRTDGPLVLDDYQHWDGRATAYEDLPIMAIVGVPVRWGGEFLGTLIVQTDASHAFSSADAELLGMFANQAAIALRNVHLFRAERGQRELAEALAEAAAVVGSTLDLDQVLDRILAQVERVVPGDAFNVMLIEEDNARVVRRRGYDRMGGEDWDGPVSVPIATYPNLMKMARQGEPAVVPDTAADPNWVPAENREWRRSYVGAPIRVGGVTVGFLNVNGTRPGQFGPADARQLKIFAHHAAAAIENAWLYQELRDYTGRLEGRVRERTAELRAQYARLDAILCSTADGIIVADLGGEILQANPVAHAWLNQTLSPEDASRLREAVRDLAARADGRPGTVLELKGLDLELKAAPVVGADEEEPTVVVAAHDVSYLKALDRMKTRFVTNVSHELRTPITTIKLYAALMQRISPEDGKWPKYLDALVREADHQARLVVDILQISRIDAGRLEMNPRPTPLDALVEEVVASHQVLAQKQGLILKYQPADPGPVALVDHKRMGQVLNNLVENAIHYTPEGGEVVVSTRRERVGGRTWAVAMVADTGMGILEEELPHVFDRFFRGTRPQQMQISGTGLGLAIAKEIVELHGGRVTVDSQVDVGTTFTVWLPSAD
jgi:signal transduction histidine kinase